MGSKYKRWKNFINTYVDKLLINLLINKQKSESSAGCATILYITMSLA